MKRGGVAGICRGYIMKDIDYKELLTKYINMVKTCEGVSFIDEADWDGDFTTQEIKALRELSNEDS
mgnify:CR=1 FL=1